MGFLGVNATEFDDAVADLETRLTERGATMLPILKDPELKQRVLHGWQWSVRDMMSNELFFEPWNERIRSLQAYRSTMVWLCEQRRNSAAPELYAMREAIHRHLKIGRPVVVGTESDPEYEQDLKDYADYQRLSDENRKLSESPQWLTYYLVEKHGCVVCAGSGQVSTPIGVDEDGYTGFQCEVCPSCHGSPKVTQDQQAAHDAVENEIKRISGQLRRHRFWTCPPAGVRDVYLLLP